MEGVLIMFICRFKTRQLGRFYISGRRWKLGKNYLCVIPLETVIEMHVYSVTDANLFFRMSIETGIN